jgi:hypothetical protein
MDPERRPTRNPVPSPSSEDDAPRDEWVRDDDELLLLDELDDTDEAPDSERDDEVM